MNPELSPVIARSNARINKALATLNNSARGQQVLRKFKEMATGRPVGKTSAFMSQHSHTSRADGLDSDGMAALVAITQEFAKGRRDFLDTIN